MSDTTATAPAPEEPATLVNLKRQIEEFRKRAEREETTLAQVVELTDLKRTLDSALKTVKDELAPRHDELLDSFGDEGVTSKRHKESGKLVYSSRRIWARAAEGVDKAVAAEALLADPDLAAFSERGFNVQSLSAFFNEKAKELEADGTPVTEEALAELVPEAVRDSIALAATHQIGVRS